MRTIIAVCLACIIFTGTAWAHSPREVRVTLEQGWVKVAVRHETSSPSSHYVKLITVYRNGKEADKKEFTSQEGDLQEAEFFISGLVSGDTLIVEATCSRYGSLQQEVRVP